MAEIFSHPSDFVYHVGKDLIINHAEIYGDILAAITDYKNQNYFDYGVDVGKAAAKTLIGSKRSETITMQIMDGIITEYGGAAVLASIAECNLDTSGESVIIM
jgi:hypothetical protein